MNQPSTQLYIASQPTNQSIIEKISNVIATRIIDNHMTVKTSNDDLNAKNLFGGETYNIYFYNNMKVDFNYFEPNKTESKIISKCHWIQCTFSTSFYFHSLLLLNTYISQMFNKVFSENYENGNVDLSYIPEIITIYGQKIDDNGNLATYFIHQINSKIFLPNNGNSEFNFLQLFSIMNKVYEIPEKVNYVNKDYFKTYLIVFTTTDTKNEDTKVISNLGFIGISATEQTISVNVPN